METADKLKIPKYKKTQREKKDENILNTLIKKTSKLNADLQNEQLLATDKLETTEKFHETNAGVQRRIKELQEEEETKIASVQTEPKSFLCFC